MKTTNDKIRKWGELVGITGENGTGKISKQYSKLCEEVGELGEGLLEGDEEKIKDAIGVVLILLAEMNLLTYEECKDAAYEVIIKRVGKGGMVDGSFVKDWSDAAGSKSKT